MPTDQVFWARLAGVASVVWIAIIVIASEVSRDFRWFPYLYRNDMSLGPAAITTVAGLVIIAAVCAGIPWIVNRR